MNTISTGIDYVVVDANGKEWARYCYERMAENVCERLNMFPPLNYTAPFRFESQASK